MKGILKIISELSHTFLSIIRSPEFIFLSFLLVFILFFILNSGYDKKVYLVEGLEVLQPENSVKFDESWFEENCKVVVYMKHARRLDSWMNYIENYPAVPFLFYYAGDDLVSFKNDIDKIGFNFPVMLDTNGQFYEKNKSNMDDYSFISFVISDNSVSITNPTISNFRSLLRKCEQSNK